MLPLPGRSASTSGTGLERSFAAGLRASLLAGLGVLALAGWSGGAADEPVRIVAPGADEILVGEVRIRAEVDGDSGVTSVDFVIDGRLVFSDTTAPYELLWDAGGAAAHHIEARAWGADRLLGADIVRTRAAPTGADEVVAFNARVDRVQLHVRVPQAVDDGTLGPGDFEVLEDGSPQEVVEVARVSDLPIAVGLMVDCSRSMVERLEPALEAAESFVEALLELPDDKIYTMAFADLPMVLQDFTDDADRLVTSFELVPRGYRTRLYDSIVAAVGRFSGIEGRRALVILTDGHDEGSRHDLADAIAAAQRADVALYPVGVDLSLRYFRERWVLGRMAEASGGRVSYLSDPEDAEEIYGAITADLREQYRITYEPSRSLGDGAWRPVEVRLAGLDDDVRARPGYFAE